MTPDPYDGVSLLPYDDICDLSLDEGWDDGDRLDGLWHATLEPDPEDDPADQLDFLERYAGL